MTALVLTPSIGRHYFGEVLAGLTRKVTSAGGRLVIVQTLDADARGSAPGATADVSTAIAWSQVDGIVSIANAVSGSYLKRLHDAGKPVVLTSTEIPDFDAPVALPDNHDVTTAQIRVLTTSLRRLTPRPDVLRRITGAMTEYVQRSTTGAVRARDNGTTVGEQHLVDAGLLDPRHSDPSRLAWLAGSHVRAGALAPWEDGRSSGHHAEHGLERRPAGCPGRPGPLAGPEPGPLSRSGPHDGAAPLEQDHVVPLAATAPQPLAHAHAPEPVPRDHRQTRRVVGEHPGLDRPDAAGLRALDQRTDQGAADAPPACGGGHVAADLDDPGIGAPPAHPTGRDPAQHRAVGHRDQAVIDQVVRVPGLPGRHGGLEGRGSQRDALGVDRQDGSGVVGDHGPHDARAAHDAEPEVASSPASASRAPRTSEQQVRTPRFSRSSRPTSSAGAQHTGARYCAGSAARGSRAGGAQHTAASSTGRATDRGVTP